MHHESRRVDVLDLAARAPFLRAGLTNRDVHVGAHGAFFHVAIAGAERAQNGAQLVEVSCRFFRGANVGTRDDFHQRYASAIEIDEGFAGAEIVDRFAGVLLQVEAFDADRDRLFAVGLHFDFALADDRVFVLADLVALRQIRIEIVLPVEPAPAMDFSVQAQPSADRLLDAELIDHRQHARHRRIDQRHMRIRRTAIGGAGAGKELRVRAHLRVHFEPADNFPLALLTGDELVRAGGSNIE